jgi:RNA polymerase sigma-70 factor (ECF subfamily)
LVRGGVVSPVVGSDAADPSPQLESLMARFGALLRHATARHRLSPAEADEIVQDTRIRLWRALGSADRLQAATASYLYRTAVSAALDHLRRDRARREDPLPPDVQPLHRRTPPDAIDRVLATETAEAVGRALELLIESRRVVVRLHLTGYDKEEIAALLGWSEAKTRNLLYRGLADLRETLTAWGIGPGGTDG